MAAVDLCPVGWHPADLIRDRQRTPFNLGRAITLEGFSPQESRPLAAKLGLPDVQAETVLAAILHWTAGQPFLTQKLCRLVWQHHQVKGSLPFAPEAPAEVALNWISNLVQRQVIQNWEAKRSIPNTCERFAIACSTAPIRPVGDWGYTS
ncbi:MAG: hypothetical protein HC922_02965 [Leptolyngbyaceae cyanobacterium SM2_3_12]|nr:hypothetical protein [Leptolyngbyaceae cyanobacterium SM2_3_12]